MLRQAEPDAEVDHQRRLVVLGREHVVAPGVEDRRTQVSLAEQRVAGNDVPPDRQNPQQLQGCLVLVALGIDLDLGQDRLGCRAVGRDEVVAG